MGKKVKRSYKKPNICKVNLTPEEAVLAACKATSGTAGRPPAATKCVGKCASARAS